MNREFVVSLFQPFIFQTKTNDLNPFVQCPEMNMVSKDSVVTLYCKEAHLFMCFYGSIHGKHMCLEWM